MLKVGQVRNISNHSYFGFKDELRNYSETSDELRGTANHNCLSFIAAGSKCKSDFKN